MIYDPNALPPWEIDRKDGPITRQLKVRQTYKRTRRNQRTEVDSKWEDNGNRWASHPSYAR